MGLHIIRPDTNFNFIGIRKLMLAISGTIIALGVLSLVWQGGPRYGIDFAGGVTVQVKMSKAVELAQFQDALADTGLPGVLAQRFGQEDDNEYLVRISTMDVTADQASDKISEALKAQLADNPFEIQRQEMVGPKVGADLRSKAMEAMFYAVLLIAIYISGRFEQRWMVAGVMAAGLAAGVYLLGLTGMSMAWMTIGALLITTVLCWRLRLNYALGAVVALIHDVFITVGVFSFLGKEFDLTTVAALLTIIGYSLNDTIIVYDRIRENLRAKAAPDLAGIINLSVNQTLSRTLLTAGTTLLAVAALLFFGGGVIHDFALALFVGILVGTYSSIYVASPVLLGFESWIKTDEAPTAA
ncbi:MAG: protein translocase subunit SecF [Thermodesulfobacteriota bacterium]